MNIKAKYKKGQIVSTTGGRLLKIRGILSVSFLHPDSTDDHEVLIEYSCSSIINSNAEFAKVYQQDLITVKDILKQLKEAQ